jgi:hypothetical protein
MTVRKANILAFDDFVVGATTVYTPTGLNDALGAYDKAAIQAVADQVTGTSVTLKVQIEHSSDQRNWASKNTTAEIPATSISTTATTPLVGTDAGTTPSLAFVRLAITVAGTSPQAHVKVWVCLRDEGA